VHSRDATIVHGHDAGDIKKAKEAGYHTCEALLMNTRKVAFSEASAACSMHAAPLNGAKACKSNYAIDKP